jgi:predicted AAA+ superfamily ATPase
LTQGSTLVLEASYIVHLLPPYHVNFGKRLVKTPKLCYYDTGLANCLPDIRESRQLEMHPARAPFESLLVLPILDPQARRN